MPTQFVTLEETSKTILKRCFNDVIKEVVHRMGIPYETVVTVHNGMDVAKTDNKSNATMQAVDNLPTTVSQRRLLAVVTDNYNEDSLSSTTVSQRDTHPVFLDHEVDCVVYPVYVKTDITIAFEYTTPSRTEALRLRDDIRIKLSDSRNILHHEVEYDILIPEPICDFIEDVHTLRNRLTPMDLTEYFLAYSTKRVHMVTDMANPQNSRIAIRERMTRIIGIMDFSPEPEPIDQDKETNTYKLSIPYKLSIDIPRGMCFSYPPMVCNRPMPAKYLDYIAQKKLDARYHRYKELGWTQSLGALSYFEVPEQLERHVDMDLPKNIPMWDEFPARQGHAGYVTLYTFLTEVDETDKKTLLNLRDLGDYRLNSELLNFIRDVERPWIINPYMSFFYISLYQPRAHSDNNILEITQDLTVRSKKPLKLLRPVRVAINVCLDTTFLNPLVQERMCEHPNIYLMWLSELVTGMRNLRELFVEMKVADSTFYRSFVQVLNRAMGRDEYDFIRKFVCTLARDTLAIQSLVGLLKHGYPRLYSRLCSVIDLEAFKYNDVFKRDDIGYEMYSMRTVMLTATQVAHASDK